MVKQSLTAGLIADIRQERMPSNWQTACLNDLLGNLRMNKELSIHAPDSKLISLPKKLLESARNNLQAVREDGIYAYNLECPLKSEDFRRLMDWHKAEYPGRLYTVDQTISWLQRINRHNGLGQGEPKVYRIQNAFSYAICKDIGWIDQADLAWLLEEFDTGSKKGDFDGQGDSGFFMAANPLSIEGYITKTGGFYGKGSVFQEILGLSDTDPQINLLMRSSVLLEIDLRSYKNQIPPGEDPCIFALRDFAVSDGEVIAPVAAMCSGKFATKAIAVIEAE